MNDVTSLLDAQATALLRRLSREQETRTRRLREDAELQVRELLRRSRSEARARVHQAVMERRRADENAFARRRAALDTRQRRARQATLRELLEAAWRGLPAALQARWEDRAGRTAWCEAACAQAAQLLLDLDEVAVEVDEHAAPELGEAIARSLEGRGVRRAVVTPIAGLGAGLRLRAGRACVDATIPGLLASRERVAAELLAAFEGLLGRKDTEPQP
jgi:hypothetical protein